MIPENFDIEVDGKNMMALKQSIANGENIAYFRGIAPRLVYELRRAIVHILPENPNFSDINKKLWIIIQDGLGIYYHSGEIHRAVCRDLEFFEDINMLMSSEDLFCLIDLKTPKWSEVNNG